MAFEQGVANNQEDLVSRIFTFLTSNGWTQEELDTGANKASISRGNVFVHFRWDGSDGDNIALYQSLGFTGGNDPWNHPNDSGSGTTLADLNNERRVEGIGNGPFTQYFFFADDATAPYFYCVLEYSPGLYRHFGFGEIEKVGSWTGGEWCGGHDWEFSPSSPISTSHSVLLDALHSAIGGPDENAAATIHIGTAQFPNQFASEWANVGNGTGLNWRGNDRSGAERSKVIGGIRGGFMPKAHGGPAPSPLNGFVNLLPIPLFYVDEVPTDKVYVLLGFMVDCRHVNIKNFQPGDELSVGGDTWKLFPIVRKRFENDGQAETRNGGIAYRKVS